MILFAHRGARAHAPENTLEAFRLALEMGATGLESDVWLTLDGVPVLDHDGLVGPERDVPIVDTPRAALPPHIPALADLVAECGTDYDLSLDLKDPAAFGATVAVVRSAGLAGRTWLCHHRWRQLAAWRQQAPDVLLVDSTYLGFMSTGPAGRAERLAAAGIDAVNLHHSEWNAELRQVMAARGLRCLGWDAQTPEQLAAMADLDLDGVYSDHVDRLTALLP